MKLLISLFLFLFVFAYSNTKAEEFDNQFPFTLENDFQSLLLKRVAEKLPLLVKF
jgi:hypothetical protein